jgi:hypothetical protein
MDTITESVSEQPFDPVMVTEYVVVAVGVTTITEVVSPVLHR